MKNYDLDWVTVYEMSEPCNEGEIHSFYYRKIRPDKLVDYVQKCTICGKQICVDKKEYDKLLVDFGKSTAE